MFFYLAKALWFVLQPYAGEISNTDSGRVSRRNT